MDPGISLRREEISVESVAALESQVESLRVQLNKNQNKHAEFGKLLEFGEREFLEPIFFDDSQSGRLKSPILNLKNLQF